MKKYIVCLGIFFLSACSISKPIDTQIEVNASITIVMNNQAYAQKLKALWKKSYPAYHDVLHIRIEPYTFHQQFYADIEWVKDSDAIYKLPYSQEWNGTIEYAVPSSLQRENLHQYFIPMEGEGYLFAYKDASLKKYKLNVSDLTSFEKIIKKQGYYYFYNHRQPNLLPLWISDYVQGDTPIDDVWDDEAFLTAVKDFKQLYKEMHLIDDIYDDASFFDHQYTFGLVDPKEAKNSSLYKNGSLHFCTMPSYHERKLSPFVDTYGFMISKDCKYPQCVKAFVEMVRSKEGIQAYLDAGEGIPLLKEKDMKDFRIYDARMKEMIIAVESSKLWDLSLIKEKPSIRYKELYEKSDSDTIIQNGIWAGLSEKQIQDEIRKHMKKWVWKQ